MPNRVLKDVILTSEGLDQVSAEAEVLFYRLLVVADDYGRFVADPRVILARCFPLKVDALRSSTVGKWYRELEQASVMGTYRIDGKLYGQFLEWLQRKRNSQQKFPPPDDPGAAVAAPQGEFPQQSAAICGESPPTAATCGEPPPPAARACVRPQSQSEEKKRFRIKAAPILSTNVDNSKESARGGPRISIDQPAATRIAPTVAAVLSRLQSQQKGPGSPCPEAGDVTTAVVATERSPP